MLSKLSHPYLPGKRRKLVVQSTAAAPDHLSSDAALPVTLCVGVGTLLNLRSCFSSAPSQLALCSLSHRVSVRTKCYFKCITFRIISDIWQVPQNYLRFLIAWHLKYSIIYISAFYIQTVTTWALEKGVI